MKPGQNTYTLVGQTGLTVSFTFEADKQLVALELQAGMSPEQLQWVKANLPLNEAGLKDLMAKAKKAQLVKTEGEVTFQQFYDAYGKKEKRIRAEAVWNKMSHESRVAAYVYIAKLKKNYEKANTNLPHPDTYLTNRRWED